jgi:hypothetical protein
LIRVLATAAVLLAACGDDSGERPEADAAPAPDAAPLDDAMTEADAAAPDPDAAAPAPDAATPDAAAPDAAPECLPGPETCNGDDDDCDGRADEDFRVGQPCGIGVGACRAATVVTCGDDGAPVCLADPGPPNLEACNGLDDDCDGLVDEDFDADGDGAPRCDGDPCAECADDLCQALCEAQDCHDEDPTVFPSAADRCGDAIDQNCDGADAPCTVATGRVDALQIAAADRGDCPDANLDGRPDNTFALLGGVANAALAEAVAGGTVNLFLSAAGLAPPGHEGVFDLAVLYALPDEAGGWALDPQSLDEHGAPRIALPGARVRGGQLRAGPTNLALALPVLDFELRLTLRQLHVFGALDVAAGEPSDALRLGEGILWGVVSDADLQAALDAIEAGCAAADPPPEACGPLANLRPALPNLLRLDQDLDGDGALDAYSLCLDAAVAPATLTGWP